MNFLKISRKTYLLLAVALFFIVCSNFSFYKNVLTVYPLELKNIAFLASLVIVLFNGIVILLSLLCSKYTTKPVIIFLLIVTSLSSYFMDIYGVVIDDSMIDNLVKTDVAEALDLISLKLFLYLFFFGILPSIYIYKVEIIYQPFSTELFSGIKRVFICLLIAVAVALPSSDFYASFIREHKPLRYYTNPTYYIFSAIKYVNKKFKVDSNAPIIPLGLDAEISTSSTGRELVILVVGETARADRFSLNGYSKKTNAYLEKEKVISFPDFHSCGTATATSVPCMFSHLAKNEFSVEKAARYENLLDVLKYAGVNVLWRDNNSDSKGVALRVPYESYKGKDKNTICDPECRDVGMLVDLQDYINQNKKGDIFIVLHQMGNHGPAYYKRYPKDFERFKPVCKTNQLGDCSIEEINNAYDNAILYTDFFLSKTIAFLKQNSAEFKTAMFYMSDHGESLGEGGIYLHGLPYIMAPEAQTHVPAVMWFGKGFKVNETLLRSRKAERYSHDNIFHTVLGFMGVKTKIYNKQLDILNH